MNYAYHYFRIITNRVEHPLTKEDCYVERHHIIPKSEGGSDDKDNLVNLTAREHYIAHLLLAKIYNDYKMWSAVNYMMTRASGRKFKFNSHLYKKAREEFGQKQSQRLHEWWNEERKQAFSKKITGQQRTIETRQKIARALTGNQNAKGQKRVISIEHRRKLSERMRGRHLSEETKMKLSLSHKGIKPPSPLGKHWFNNGTIETYSFECPEGFVKGRLKK